jgi:hypothetical protein
MRVALPGGGECHARSAPLSRRAARSQLDSRAQIQLAGYHATSEGPAASFDDSRAVGCVPVALEAWAAARRDGFGPSFEPIRTLGSVHALHKRQSCDEHRMMPRRLGEKGNKEQIMKELIMTEGRRLTFALYVDRSSQQWIVLDPHGQFWIVPANEENAWDQRQPFCPTDETELEPVPAHYKYMLGLPA